MARKLSEILKDRKIFSKQQEKRIHKNALKEAELSLLEHKQICYNTDNEKIRRSNDGNVNKSIGR